jgi:hypothetical protein
MSGRNDRVPTRIQYVLQKRAHHEQRRRRLKKTQTHARTAA